ncbi:MAG: DUF4286 family protein [Rhodanobacteraceae bacterium]
MPLYTVDLEVEAAIRDDYLAWLREHVAEMLTLQGFLGAKIYARLELVPSSDVCAFVVHYRLRDRAAFNGYLAEHATRMREAGLRHWGERARARRDLLQELE